MYIFSVKNTNISYELGERAQLIIKILYKYVYMSYTISIKIKIKVLDVDDIITSSKLMKKLKRKRK